MISANVSLAKHPEDMHCNAQECTFAFLILLAFVCRFVIQFLSIVCPSKYRVVLGNCNAMLSLTMMPGICNAILSLTMVLGICNVMSSLQWCQASVMLCYR